MQSIVEKLKVLKGVSSFDTPIETGEYGLTKEEEVFLIQNGYYDRAVTERALALIAQGLPCEPLGLYGYSYSGFDGVSECVLTSLEEMQQQFIGCYCDSAGSCHNDVGGGFALPSGWTWADYGLVSRDGWLTVEDHHDKE